MMSNDKTNSRSTITIPVSIAEWSCSIILNLRASSLYEINVTKASCWIGWRTSREISTFSGT
uniref:Uncharacterized protein n=1 Tax=uncultured marine virus TaxID=186617 RepID=A0A0F7L6S2_9VIRU|nr:hypothetical protein [uncultured marine virus]